MLKAKDLGLKRDRWILRNIDLQFKKGKIYGIIGKSGAGKTTLLKVMAGLLDSTEGEVFFHDKKVIGPSIKLIPGYDDIQLVNQDFALEPFHTVEQNVREKVLSRHQEDQEVLINEFLELVELDKLRTQKANQLSGGEQQRLSLARALACEPEVLLLDEPFVHLDQRLRWKVMNYLNRLHKELNTIVVLVSHDGAEMMGFVDEVINLSNGIVQRSGSVAEVYYNPANRQEAELMGEINEVEIGGKIVLFRPNEYEISDEGELKVKFIRALDTGLTIFNYFETQNGEVIMLSAEKYLKTSDRISIRKRL
ncbi:MAG: ABC transporter ATP-binding protein [Crocinitomicaceae bacterium]|nr:ABC transporter ATP-binding protein [Crocinitomicaceae bacterium]